jgi:hypothetical protein
MQCPLIKTRIFNFSENIKNYRNKILILFLFREMPFYIEIEN